MKEYLSVKKYSKYLDNTKIKLNKIGNTSKEVLLENAKGFLTVLLSAVIIGYFAHDILVIGAPQLAYGFDITILTMVATMVGLSGLYYGYNLGWKHRNPHKLTNQTIKVCALSIAMITLMFATLNGIVLTTFPWFFNEVGIEGSAMFYHSIAWVTAWTTFVGIVILFFFARVWFKNPKLSPDCEICAKKYKVLRNTNIFMIAGFFATWMFVLTGAGLWGITLEMETSSTWVLVDSAIGPQVDLVWEQVDQPIEIDLPSLLPTITVGWNILDLNLIGGWGQGNGVVNNWQSTIVFTFWLSVALLGFGLGGSKFFGVSSVKEHANFDRMFVISSLFLISMFTLYFILQYIVLAIYGDLPGTTDVIGFVNSTNPTPVGFDPEAGTSADISGGTLTGTGTSEGDTLVFTANNQATIQMNFYIAAVFFGLTGAFVGIFFIFGFTSIIMNELKHHAKLASDYETYKKLYRNTTNKSKKALTSMIDYKTYKELYYQAKAATIGQTKNFFTPENKKKIDKSTQDMIKHSVERSLDIKSLDNTRKGSWDDYYLNQLAKTNKKDKLDEIYTKKTNEQKLDKNKSNEKVVTTKTNTKVSKKKTTKKK